MSNYGAMPGFDPGRMNNDQDTDPKYVFARWAHGITNGGQTPLTGEHIRQFVAQDPRWEIDPASSQDDPHIRVRQNALDAWKPGQSMWQDVIRDSGGAGGVQFNNVDQGGGNRAGAPWPNVPTSLGQPPTAAPTPDLSFLTKGNTGITGYGPGGLQVPDIGATDPYAGMLNREPQSPNVRSDANQTVDVNAMVERVLQRLLMNQV